MIGGCFYYDTPPNGQHLYVVLAPSLEKTGWFVCANITTRRIDSDTSCELLRGEHPELRSDVSIVVYAEAREMPPPLIQRYMQQQHLEPISGELLLRIQRSALVENSRLQKKLQQAIRRHLGI